MGRCVPAVRWWRCRHLPACLRIDPVPRRLHMEQYWVEGLFANRQGIRKEQKTGVMPASAIEPFARALWANSPDEAVRMATEALKGGRWIESPRISRLTEEQRMRA